MGSLTHAVSQDDAFPTYPCFLLVLQGFLVLGALEGKTKKRLETSRVFVQKGEGWGLLLRTPNPS